MKKPIKKMYRHGDLGLLKISKIPKGLKETKSKVLIVGSHGNSHTFDNGKLYLSKENDFVFGYFKAKNTKIFHPEHSPEGAEIFDGFYQLLKQNEYINNELKQIID